MRSRPYVVRSSLDSRRSGDIKLRFEEIRRVFPETGVFSRFRQLFFSDFECFLHFDDPTRPDQWSPLDLFFGELSLGSSALHPTLAGRVRVGSKPDRARLVDSPMSNDVQQMPFQILDLELPFYLRTLDLQFILCKKIDENAW